MQYTINRGMVHQHAYELLRTCLRMPDFSATCTTRIVLHVIFAACARACSLCSACWNLLTAPSRETIRKAIHSWLPQRQELLRRLNRALAFDIPRGWRRHPQQIAIDLTLIPYHGLPLLDELEVYRGQAKSGTTHFHAYATAYVNYRGQRYTLAMTFVEAGEKMEAVLKRLLKRLSALGIRVRMLLLDRGFWSVAVIRYLQHARYGFLMPVVIRGRKEDHPEGPGGTRIFACRKRSGWDEYKVTAGNGQAARVNICIHCRNYNGQWGRHGRQALVYAFWGIQPGSTRWVREAYRKRFAIEASYRQMLQAKPRTCTRNPEVRLLLVGIALVLRNVWVWLHYMVLSTPRRGNPRLNLIRLSFETLLLWLLHQAEHELGRRDFVSSQRPWPA